MTKLNKNDFMQKNAVTLGEILDMTIKLPFIHLQDLPGEHSILIVIDMINAFTREGSLKSSRVEKLIPEIASLSGKCDELRISKLAFADWHTQSSLEFEAFPAHAIQGSSETEIVDELKKIGGYSLIHKNSTNCFLEEGFQIWLRENPQTDTFIITGCCTDICIQQFSITLKSWFNMHDKKSRIIVPVNAIDTYDLDMHNGDLMNIMGLYNMILNGIEVVRGVN